MADTFTVSDHKVLCVFRNRLRRKAVWAVINPLHQQFIEAVEIYRPFEVPGKAEPSLSRRRRRNPHVSDRYSVQARADGAVTVVAPANGTGPIGTEL